MRVLVTGASGQVGSELVRELSERAELIRRGPRIEAIGVLHSALDVADRDAVMTTVGTIEPDIIIHSAALTAVDRCETEFDLAYAVNAFGTRNIQEAARQVRAHVVYLSTDYVFDGTANRPYVEWDSPNPQSVYGSSKLGGERELDADATIVRTSWVCGAVGANMAKTVLRLSGESDAPLRFVDDQRGSPTMARDLAEKTVELAMARLPGVFHVTNQGETSWFGFAQAVVEFAGGDSRRVEPIKTGDLDPKRPAPRPANSVLDNAALRFAGLSALAEWRSSLRDLVRELTA